MQNQYICVVFKLSDRLKPMVFCSSYLYWRNVDDVTRYCCRQYKIILMRMYISDINYKICYCLDTLVSCHLKWFLDLARFHFQGGLSFLTMLCWAKVSYWASSTTHWHLRNRAWPRSGHCPLFPFYKLFEQLLQSLVLLTSCVPTRVRWRMWLIRST